MPKVNFFTQSLEFIFHQVTELRRKLYDVRIFKTHKFQVPILSVGNVSFGGTGKTPFVLWLCSFMDKRKLSYAVVARSYGGTITSPTRVDPDSVPGAFEYGDEPFLLSQRLSNTDIYVGSKKYAVAAFALTQKKYNVLILDDGFQHFPLKRDLDIVLIDAAAGVEILKRESWKSLQRAQVLVFTKINYTTKDQLETFKAFIPQGKIILNASYRSSLKSWTEDGKILNLENLRGKKVYSFCGLGNPEIFFKSIDEKNPQIHLKRTFRSSPIHIG
ncbi:MAG TPA: tetraacyldisaccharide 4'-kinase [Pseudobdellovibrionaceae bacterium]|nr:tetraacyldisaccharide 4'-kinase [Pseudobdellovibrionaceae bacterium]